MIRKNDSIPLCDLRLQWLMQTYETSNFIQI